MSGAAVSSAAAFRELVLDCDSVTLATEQWCRERGIGQLPLRARVHSRATIGRAPQEMPIRRGPGEPLFFRRITLMAGNVPILDADNWFLPTRLPEAAVTRLLTTDTPFGTALRPGIQTRSTTTILVPPGTGDLGRGAEESADVALLTLRGVAELDGVAVSFVEERFRRDVLD